MSEREPLIVDGPRRDEIAAVIDDIAAACRATPPTELDEIADRALLHAYLGHDDSADALEAAIAAFGEHAHLPALYGGIARLGWLVAHVADGEVADEVCGAIDARLLQLVTGEQVK